MCLLFWLLVGLVGNKMGRHKVDLVLAERVLVFVPVVEMVKSCVSAVKVGGEEAEGEAAEELVSLVATDLAGLLGILGGLLLVLLGVVLAASSRAVVGVSSLSKKANCLLYLRCFLRRREMQWATTAASNKEIRHFTRSVFKASIWIDDKDRDQTTGETTFILAC